MGPSSTKFSESIAILFYKDIRNITHQIYKKKWNIPYKYQRKYIGSHFIWYTSHDVDRGL